MTRSLLPSLFRNDNKNRPVFQSLHDEIDRVFDDFRETFSGFGDQTELSKTSLLTPKIDVSESENTVDISAELPGVKEEDIDVTVTDNILTIKGQKSAEREEKEKDYHLVERSQGSFMRSIPLGFSVDDSKVEANISDGVLKISITKPAEVKEKTKKIAIGKAA